MRIGICGIHIESSTFTPYLSTESDFTILKGEELLKRYPFITNDKIPGINNVPSYLAGQEAFSEGDREWAKGIEWVPIFHARALPGGPIVRHTYEAFKEEILTVLNQVKPLDGLFFDIHGAMSTPGLEDAEGDLISAIRAAIGEEVIVGGSMDLHGNISSELFSKTDLLTCYRMAPHEDAWVSRERAARNLVKLLRRGEKPKKAMVKVPILLPGEKTSTRQEPAKSLYRKIAAFDSLPGVIDGGYWVGFAWADQPRCSAVIAAYGREEKVISELVEDIAHELWRRREDFEFVAPTAAIGEAVRIALASNVKPFVISDSGDNPGAGGANDTTVALAQLLAQPEIVAGEKSALFASIYDRFSVIKAFEAGVGAKINASIGANIDKVAPPVALEAEVKALVNDPDGLRTAVLNYGGLDLIISERRNQYSTKAQFDRLNLVPEEYDILVVKIGYLEPYLFEIQKGWVLATTPGGVDQDLIRLGHKRIERPMYPFDNPKSVPLTVITD